MFRVPDTDAPDPNVTPDYRHPLFAALSREWVEVWMPERDQVKVMHPQGCWYHFDADLLDGGQGSPPWQVLADAMAEGVSRGLKGLCVLTLKRHDDGSLTAAPGCV